MGASGGVGELVGGIGFIGGLLFGGGEVGASGGLKGGIGFVGGL